MKHVSDRPNIVLVVVDTARRERFGCYGYGRGTTPVIDNFARGGAVYDRMISTAPWTLPSHASLFTGLYTREHGAERPILRMHSGIPTLAEHFHAEGYATAIFSNNRLISKRTGLVDGESETLRGSKFGASTRGQVYRLQTILGQTDRGASATNNTVRDFLARRSRPVFVFINYMECHGHYRPPRLFERRFVQRRFTGVDSVRHRMRMRHRSHWDGLGWSLQDTELLSDLYDASLACIDTRIGDLLEILDEHLGESVVILTADHGENLGDHGRIGHELSLDQTLIQVPFIARIPGFRPTRISGLAQLTDVFASLCRVAGIPVPPHLRDRRFGVDLFRLEPNDSGRPYAFSEWKEIDGSQLQQRKKKSAAFVPTPSAESVQDGQYKLIVEPGTQGEQLYDLIGDPDETRNEVARLPEVRQRLLNALEQWRLECQPVGTTKPFTAEDERILTARLEELGYL